jgi:hypothetical protein
MQFTISPDEIKRFIYSNQKSILSYSAALHNAGIDTTELDDESADDCSDSIYFFLRLLNVPFEDMEVERENLMDAAYQVDDLGQYVDQLIDFYYVSTPAPSPSQYPSPIS